MADPISGPPGPADALRLTRLRRMKALATGLLLLAAVVYLLTLDTDGVLGFVNAGSEAAMVGALADWFAVTALFRHPLGLPIPHTALIRTRKDSIGAELEEFVTQNFLAEPVVRDKLARAQVSRRVGVWLSDPDHAARVAAEAAVAGQAVLNRVRDDDVVFLMENVLFPRAAALPTASIAGSLLDGLLDDGTHQELLDVGLEQLAGWLENNSDRVIELVTDQAPIWSPQWLDRRVGRRIYREIVDWVFEIRSDPRHRARAALDDLLRRFAQALQEDEAVRAQVVSLTERLLANPELREATLAIWGTVRRLLLEAVEDPTGELRKRVEAGLVEFGDRLAEPGSELAARLDEFGQDAAGYVVRGFAGEIATVISDTVARWDAEDASRRIELYVGRDLQFIRINGTVVGAAAGVLIHTATVLIT
ncbi:DUF445 domain-containing protein [Spongisporangium articulatum]|uniref:DUF445 domain-containing protein n=1 Tax=Spongisporangium articulatum TaxID=3362603 RepID=A0ABW8AJE3_9ACTN